MLTSLKPEQIKEKPKVFRLYVFIFAYLLLNYLQYIVIEKTSYYALSLGKN